MLSTNFLYLTVPLDRLRDCSCGLYSNMLHMKSPCGNSGYLQKGHAPKHCQLKKNKRRHP